MKFSDLFRSRISRFGLAAAAVLVASIGLAILSSYINSTTVALVLLIAVLTAATFFGRNPALLASCVAMLCFNYFFLPPVHTWTIADPQNLVAWAAFTVTALVAGELSAYARRRARESERLFEELQAAFQKATQSEALRQSEKLKSALLDAVTHDLRTPLTSIKASVTTLLDSEGGHRTIELNGNERAEFLDIINEETDRLNDFIESMVELARIEAGTANENDTLANVEEIILIAVERANRRLLDRHLKLNIEHELPLIRVNARATAEVIYNLLDNAVKYSSPDSQITVEARAHGDTVVISVSDGGRGIPVDQRERIFEKFVRIGEDQTRGLGLGLSIAKGIVEAQRGTISVRQGDDGSGSKFIVRLPIGEE